MSDAHQARPYQELYRRSRNETQRQINATYGRELLRVLGGLPDPPAALEASRVDLLLCLTRRAVAEARGPHEVATALELRGRPSEAVLVRRWAGVARGRAVLAGEAHYAVQMGPAGILRARAIGWALKRI